MNVPIDQEASMSAVQYYNRVDDVFSGKVGRKLADTSAIPRPFEHYFQQLRSDEVMYVGLRGGHVPPQLVAHAHTKESYETLYRRYFSGVYMDFDVYALLASVVEE